MSRRQEVVSKSLIVTPPKSFIPNSRFCLGLPEWCPCCIEKDKATGTDMASTDKSKCLKLKRPRAHCVQAPLSKKPVEPEKQIPLEEENDLERFNFDTTVEELNAFKEETCPANTAKNTEWAIWTVESWRAARNRKYTSDQCPANLLQSGSCEEVCDWLCKFIAEVRKSDGGEYTPRSLYLLLSGIQRHMRKVRPTEDINFSQDRGFRPLKNVCDAIY